MSQHIHRFSLATERCQCGLMSKQALVAASIEDENKLHMSALLKRVVKLERGLDELLTAKSNTIIRG